MALPMIVEEVVGPPVRPSPISAFDHCACPYPVWGLKQSSVRLVKESCREPARRWLARRTATTTWDRAWAEFCAPEHVHDWFDEYWCVFLPKMSRSLPAGARVLLARPLSTQIPGLSGHPSAGAVWDALAEAERDYPEGRIYYLEPQFKDTRVGPLVATPRDLEQAAAAAETNLRRYVERHGKRIRQQITFEEWQEKRAADRRRHQDERQRRQDAIGIARRLELLTTDVLTHWWLLLTDASYRQRIHSLESLLLGIDPVLVLALPNEPRVLCGDGDVPLRLIAHWE